MLLSEVTHILQSWWTKDFEIGASFPVVSRKHSLAWWHSMIFVYLPPRLSFYQGQNWGCCHQSSVKSFMFWWEKKLSCLKLIFCSLGGWRSITVVRSGATYLRLSIPTIWSLTVWRFGWLVIFPLEFCRSCSLIFRVTGFVRQIDNYLAFLGFTLWAAETMRFSYLTSLPIALNRF